MQMAQPTLMAPPQLGGKQRRQQPRQPLRDPPQVADGCALISSYEWNFNKYKFIKNLLDQVPNRLFITLSIRPISSATKRRLVSLFEKHAARDL